MSRSSIGVSLSAPFLAFVRGVRAAYVMTWLSLDLCGEMR
jgi:hypothetical protein